MAKQIFTDLENALAYAGREINSFAVFVHE